MTLKYEPEILFDLMKRDGDDTPSDVYLMNWRNNNNESKTNFTY